MYVRKSLFTPQSVNAPDVIEMRKEWNKIISVFEEDHIVYLDESGVNIDMTRIYGRSLGGTRCIDNAPINTPKNTTILSSIRLNGETAYTTYVGGTTKEKFVDYLENILLPTLKDNDVIIMDNMRSHHAKEVAETISRSNKNLTILYLPPYSPDFNPIEMMWSKIKAILRKLKIRNIVALPSAIKQAFDCISVNDCLGWFSAVTDRY